MPHVQVTLFVSLVNPVMVSRAITVPLALQEHISMDKLVLHAQRPVILVQATLFAKTVRVATVFKVIYVTLARLELI